MSEDDLLALRKEEKIIHREWEEARRPLIEALDKMDLDFRKRIDEAERRTGMAMVKAFEEIPRDSPHRSTIAFGIGMMMALKRSSGDKVK